MSETKDGCPRLTREQTIRLIRLALFCAEELLLDAESKAVRWVPKENSDDYACYVNFTRTLRPEQRYGFIGRCDFTVAVSAFQKDVSLVRAALSMLDYDIERYGVGDDHPRIVNVSWLVWDTEIVFGYTTNKIGGEDVAMGVNVTCRFEENKT